jgi:hypothetical protein
MKQAIIIATIVLVGWTSPASARDYYAVQNLKTLKCYVLPKKPKTMTVVLVPGSTAYSSREEARNALGSFPLCKK